MSVTGHTIWKPVTLTKGPFIEIFWHGSDKTGSRTKKYSTDTSFYTSFFSAMLTTEITFWYGCGGAQVFGKSWFYTTNFIRAGLVFLVRVPILPVLGLPFQKVRARMKLGTAKSFTLHNLSEPNHFFFGTRTVFIRAVPNLFCSANGPQVSFFQSVLQ